MRTWSRSSLLASERNGQKAVLTPEILRNTSCAGMTETIQCKAPKKKKETFLIAASANQCSIQKLLRVSRGTGIKTRTCFDLPAYEELNHPEPPSINVLDTFFRIHGTDLAVAACKRAIAEAQIATADITHTVAVTATNAGSPGYDLLVTRKLDISTAASRTLLHGVGCGGGLSAIRTAAEFVCAATSRRRPCNVLVFATEISSIQLRGELRHAVETGDFGIGPLIFGDGASALILTNRLALQKSDAQPILCLKDWAMTTVPETEALMSYLVDTGGKPFFFFLPRFNSGTGSLILQCRRILTQFTKVYARYHNETCSPGFSKHNARPRNEFQPVRL